MLNVAEAFRKAGFKPISLEPQKLSAEQIARHQKVVDSVNEYIRRLQQAHEASKNSTLVFRGHHCRKHNSSATQRQR